MNKEWYQNVLQEQLLTTVQEQFGAQQCLFQHDGAPCHKAKVITKWLMEQNIEILGPWPGNSPDLNPIENLWSIIKRRVDKQKPTNSGKMQALIMQEWTAISQDLVQKLIESMPGRIAEVLKKKALGGAVTTPIKNKRHHQRSLCKFKDKSETLNSRGPFCAVTRSPGKETVPAPETDSPQAPSLKKVAGKIKGKVLYKYNSLDLSHLVMLTPVVLDPSFIDELELIGEEHEFYTLVCAELDHFSQQGNQKAVLLFPPVSSRLRFLIHKLTEAYNTLASFSVGEGWQRRTVICQASIRRSQENGESRTRSRNENRDRFWSSASPSRKWESGRGRQNWWKRKDKKPDRDPYASGGKHGARGRGEHRKGHVKGQGQINAPENGQSVHNENGQCVHNEDGELLQSKKVSEAELSASSQEMPEGQEEVQCETERQGVQEKIAGKMEVNGSARQDHLVICQKLNENEGEDRRPGQVAAADSAGGPSDLDMRQDYVAEEQAGGLSVRSVDDQVVSEMRGIERSQRDEKAAQLSSITKDLHEMKVVEQEDKEVRAEGHEENWRKEVDNEEAEMPVEPQEEASIPLVSQEQAEIVMMVQEETKIRAVTREDKGRHAMAHKKAEVSGETQEKVWMPAEPKEEQ
ncbi:unnamed protein product [Ranitomeya imitator]|uniref:R3H domain-containing protein n=1 Tax=Ranitomeya imitator TaxID=111125 RepID=A0ABN9M1U9_9NEOB|nr:unnamed protein product [Ranitomeya imitator]